MSQDGDHYVYLIARRDGDRLSAPVKVGITSSLASRLSSIQTACPFPLSMVHFFALPERDMARSIERCFHATQAKHRSYGEWFDLAPSKALSLLGLQIVLRFHAEGFPQEDIDAAIELVGAGQPTLDLIAKLRASEEAGHE